MLTIPIHALFAADGINPNDDVEPHPRDLMTNAEVVVAVDVMSGRESLLFGRRILERVVAGSLDRDPVVLKVELDMETDDLERMTALTRVMKGHDDYRSRDD
jgi:hypothetical protein